MSSSSGGQLLVSLGSLLDDQHWHHVKLERLSTHLNLTVDKNTQQAHVPAELSHWDIHQARETFQHTQKHAHFKDVLLPKSLCSLTLYGILYGSSNQFQFLLVPFETKCLLL